MVLNSLSFSLSVKLFISLLHLNESLALLSILGCRVFSLSSLEMYCAPPFWLAEFLLKTQWITLWVFPVYYLLLFPCCFQYFFFVWLVTECQKQLNSPMALKHLEKEAGLRKEWSDQRLETGASEIEQWQWAVLSATV